ncbi:hypothetical protein EN833_15090 [Mesorhizobium sp. M4B.F.Ca.ET.190.01.1.1]|uniref:hypothetical protein n=1 Tax=unclassified Mesorhizobium TaxID=325217 RepID=UPI001091ECD5|nr:MULTISPECIES: hypothetical protein [unclassified Mesorhizobium]TGR08786.1 hypothetical protein EN843_15085 [Mesorhizobium sp. M4B.F.Ca.ET.200.01.1.1]TGS18263.1 hypothetical protein EN833_15090 [Mesorhizobium sp. M4B.F.Ca.ET.190.01.1.1]TGT30076.1 hypothetical protein EN815_15070 [Mesorhizobium sp. M4B.F.Ca.ET.172.01.1.1]
MADSGIFIATADFQKLPESLRASLLEHVLGDARSIAEQREEQSGTDRSDEGTPEYDQHFAELSPGQVREFLSGCSQKTKSAIRAMVKGESRFFHLKDVAAEIGVPVTGLTGVWSGLTRRTKTVTGDSEAYLIDWSGGEAILEDGKYADHKAELTEMTHTSFRKVLGIG